MNWTMCYPILFISKSQWVFLKEMDWVYPKEHTAEILSDHTTKVAPTTLALLWFHKPKLNPQQPKVFGVKFSLREIERIFLLKCEILSFGKSLYN